MLLPLHLTLLFTAAAAQLCGVLFAWRHRRAAGALSLILLLLAIAEWQLTSAIGALVVTVDEKRWWAEVQYVGIMSVCPLWLHFVLRYLGDDRGRSTRFALASAVAPVIVVALALTSGAHGLLWSRIELVPTVDSVRAVFHHGPAFWIAAAYNYLVLAMATTLLVRAQRRTAEPIVKQKRLMLFAGAVPWVANLLYLAGLSAPGIDPTPIAFGVTGLCAVFALADLRLLEIMPARLWRGTRER